MSIIATRYHDFSYGHRVYGHENKCAFGHGHNGRVTFHVRAEDLDSVGRVLDFSVIKSRLCQWLEDNWDHKFLMWDQDPWCHSLPSDFGLCVVPFNPTAENMAAYLLSLGPSLLSGLPCELIRVELLETRKCGVVIDA